MASQLCQPELRMPEIGSGGRHGADGAGAGAGDAALARGSTRDAAAAVAVGRTGLFPRPAQQFPRRQRTRQLSCGQLEQRGHHRVPRRSWRDRATTHHGLRLLVAANLHFDKFPHRADRLVRCRWIEFEMVPAAGYCNNTSQRAARRRVRTARRILSDSRSGNLVAVPSRTGPATKGTNQPPIGHAESDRLKCDRKQVRRLENLAWIAVVAMRWRRCVKSALRHTRSLPAGRSTPWLSRPLSVPLIGAEFADCSWLGETRLSGEP